MRQNKPSLNAEKSEFMLIGYPKQLNRAKDFPDLEVEDQKLCRVQKTKYLGLGVITDESMNWEEQLKTVKRKIKNGLGAMFKLTNILSQKQLATVYRALIESHLRYCSVIWGSLSNSKLESPQRLQNRARRLIECARYKDGWECDWLNVRNLLRCGEGEVALFSAKRWDRRNRAALIESATPCHDAQVVGTYRDSNPLRLTVLAAISEDYTTAPQHLQI